MLKRSLSSQKTSFSSGKTSCFHLRQPSYHFESAILHENHPKTRKNSVEILFLYSCSLIKEIVMYVFLFYQFDNSTGEWKQSFLQDCFFSLLLFIRFVDELNMRLITCKCNIFFLCDFVELIFFVLLHGQKISIARSCNANDEFPF